MRKILVASTFMACASLGSAYADATVELSGSWEGGVMIGNISDAEGTKLSTGVSDASEPISKDTRSSNFFQETEVVVTATSDLGSGWTANAIIEFENNANLDYDHDEIFIRFSHGSFGDFELGNRDMAGYRMVPQAASAGFEPNGGAGNRITDGLAAGELWIPAGTQGNQSAARNILTLEDIGLPTAPSGAGTGDSTKISYITPRLYGLQIGLSYAPDACEAGVTVDSPNKCTGAGTGLESNSDLAFAGGAFGDAWGVAANQAIPLEMLGLESDGLVLVGAGYYKSLLEQATMVTAMSKTLIALGPPYNILFGNGFTDNSNYFVGDGYTEWNVGALLKVNGFKISGAYRTGDLGAAAPEVSTYQVGTTYASGAWEFGVNYAHGEAKRPTKAQAKAAVAAYDGSIKTLAPASFNSIPLSNDITSADAQTYIENSVYSFGGSDTMNAWEIAANYDLGPGVKLIGAVRHYDAKQGLGAAAGTYEKIIFEMGSKINF
jgi:predicted porin